MNHVNLIGKVSSKPRIVETENGRKIAQFTLTTKEMYLDADGKSKSKSQWHRLTAWGKWVTILQECCAEGMNLAIEGRINNKFYQSAGTKRFVSEIEINDLIIL